ncbi:MAG: tRNA (uridine(34)/cytosine(34)/5-carboxymethylaminomethyluridine(34)-2'-O)-methyltransferase TrmL [Pseudomonadales bacterium]|nr:tRNA (uridine(34)/cytosine(34)/5-carboxymethylaminomethyluridine(34)-2'-O)-methyltransferase TrmL [Pseudomonadales bacterium]
MLNIVLYEPEIPPNTGNIIRLASNTGSTLHLIEPLGFRLDASSLRRAGLDYHQYATLQVHKNWPEFLEKQTPKQLYAFSTKGKHSYAAVRYTAGDYLLFGPESRGLPDTIRDDHAITAVVTLPMQPQGRSVNLSNAVAVAVYEAWRQLDFAGARPLG